jgi:YD repeat-containing protein
MPSPLLLKRIFRAALALKIKGLSFRLSSSILITLVCVFQYAAHSQDLPKITPPSPTAQAFMRYGEIPIDYSTGVPSIEVPIYTIQGKKLQLPISISYHASGIKVNDIASGVGLGWTMNCGGMVSRSVNGIRDEAEGLVRTYSNASQMLAAINTQSQIYDIPTQSLQGIMDLEYFFKQKFDNEEDGMSDRYFYKLPNGLSGVFIYDYANENNVITLPYRPIKIQKQIAGSDVSDRKLESLAITDDNGINYKFESYLVSAAKTCSEWFLKEMTSSDGTETITFNYIQQPASNTVPIESFTYQGPGYNLDVNCAPADLLSSTAKHLGQSPEFNTPVLDYITSSTAIIDFDYQLDRQDFNQLWRLAEITITPVNSASPVKKIQFNQKYFGSNSSDKRLCLDNIVMGAPGDPLAQKHTFKYESQTLPPYPYKMTIPKYNEDYWGYYNGSNANTLIPVDFISNIYDKSNGSDRHPDNGFYAKACMLKEIIYPTGGKTVFQFDRHFARNIYPYKIGNSDGYVGGFRVARITNYDENDNIAITKTYEYSGMKTIQVKKEFFSYSNTFVEKKTIPGASQGEPDAICWSTYSRELVFSSPVLPIEVAPGMPVMYTKVTEFVGTKNNSAGKTVYEYDDPYSPSDFFNQPDHPFEFEENRYYHPYHYDRGNYSPELTSKKYYAFNGTDYRIVSQEKYDFTKLYTTPFNTGIKFTKNKQFLDPTYFVVLCGGPGINCQPIIDDYVHSNIAIDTKSFQEASLLTKNENLTFDPQDSSKFLTSTINYSYYQTNLGVQEKSNLSSKGELLKTTYKYPHNLSSSEPYLTMVTKNIYSPVVEQEEFNNAKLLHKIKTNYKSWGSNIIEPENVQVQNGTNLPLENRINYLSYDTKGNVISAQKINDVPVTYLWGYNQTLPIAKVVNAQYLKSSTSQAWSLPFYTSFEEDASQVNFFYHKTGERCHVGTYVLAIPPSSSGYNQVMISYWGKTDENAPWTLVEEIVSTGGGSSKIIGSSFAFIDEVRMYPTGAQMTTYTYRTLVGATSETDANGNVTSYEYEYGRLSLIKDNDGNVVKQFDYNVYKQ